ncbi:MAG: 4-hydroxy-tetrahydrodipicolinate reductase [Rhizomicrobium sp.]
MGDVRIVVAGAAGRMGLHLVRAIHETDGAVLTGAVEFPGHSAIGQDIGVLAGLPPLGLTLATEADLTNADVVIDFTRPASSLSLAEKCAAAGVAQIVGTTGFSAEDDAKLQAAAQKIAIVKSGNMSLGICLLSALVKQAAKLLPDFDIEIVEMHHNQKADAPSGTALMLGKAAADGRSVDLEEKSVRGRDGITGPRKTGDIGFASLRGGTVVGDHQVIFAGQKERLVLSHIAEDRAIFAAGAVKAALWAAGQKPGLYGIADVLGL